MQYESVIKLRPLRLQTRYGLEDEAVRERRQHAAETHSVS